MSCFNSKSNVFAKSSLNQGQLHRVQPTCTCIHIPISVPIYLYLYICNYIPISIYLHLYTYTYTYIYIAKSIYLYLNTYTYIPITLYLYLFTFRPIGQLTLRRKRCYSFIPLICKDEVCHPIFPLDGSIP